LNKAGLFVFTSKSGFLLAILIMAGFNGCMSSFPNLPPAISTVTVTPFPTATPVTPTWTPVILPPSPTAFVPQVPDDKRIIASIDVGKAPRTMAVEGGYLWVIANDSIVRIDPQTNQVVGKPIPVTIPEEANLEAIVVSQYAVWVSMVGWGDIDRRNGIDSVLRIDPQTGEILATIQVRRGPMSLAYTPGIVWVVNFGLSARTVSRIDSKTNQLMDEPVTTGYAPYGMTVGDGSVWVVNHDDGTLTRIDPETNQIVANIPLPAEPHRVSFGEGAVWIGNWHDHSISRIDPQTNQVVGEPILIGYHAGNIAAGYGNVWVTSDYRGVEAFPAPFPEHTVLVRIDPNTNQVVDTIPIGGHPVDVEVTEDAVWVSIQNPDLVLKIRP
jgi:YVTN family beta-propeller protein